MNPPHFTLSLFFFNLGPFICFLIPPTSSRHLSSSHPFTEARLARSSDMADEKVRSNDRSISSVIFKKDLIFLLLLLLWQEKKVVGCGENEDPLSVTVLNVDIHCDSCASKIKRCVKKIKGLRLIDISICARFFASIFTLF